jgi:hypothetical protein
MWQQASLMTGPEGNKTGTCWNQAALREEARSVAKASGDQIAQHVRILVHCGQSHAVRRRFAQLEARMPFAPGRQTLPARYDQNIVLLAQSADFTAQGFKSLPATQASTDLQHGIQAHLHLSSNCRSSRCAAATWHDRLFVAVKRARQIG